MDSYYDVQIKSGPTTVGSGQQYYGPARQFGSGAAGLGALAVRVGRSTLPLLYKYALPVVKRVGRNLVTAAILELGEVLKGRKKLKQVLSENSTQRNFFWLNFNFKIDCIRRKCLAKSN